MPLSLATPLRDLKGIGPTRAAELEARALKTIEDLLFHLPFRYEDRSLFFPTASPTRGLGAAVRGRVVPPVLRRPRARAFTIFEAVVEAGRGSNHIRAPSSAPQRA